MINDPDDQPQIRFQIQSMTLMIFRIGDEAVDDVNIM